MEDGRVIYSDIVQIPVVKKKVIIDGGIFFDNLNIQKDEIMVVKVDLRIDLIPNVLNKKAGVSVVLDINYKSIKWRYK